jgi:LPXTG-site transpeptidase (sortase) family protein
MRWAGNLLIATSLAGFVLLGLVAAEVQPSWVSPGRPAAVVASKPIAVGAVAPAPPAPPSPTVAAASATAFPAQPTLTTPKAVELPVEPRLPIERIAIPTIGLDAEVVPAGLIQQNGALTWEIPKHKAGHAEGTAGAGALGNAVLLGHVDSLRSGDVFRQLENVSVGDRVTVRSGGGLYTYEVVEARAVERADTSMVQTTQRASLTLFTCHGQWLPTIWDYTHRFVVRAELREITA